MTRSGGKRGAWVGWGVLVGALVLGDLTASCGTTSDVLTGNRGAAGASDDADSGAGRGGRAGRAGSGALNGNGGSTASGGATTGPGEGGVAGGRPRIDPTDPNAAERKKLADDLCGKIEDYPCLYYVPQRSLFDPRASTVDKIAQCTHDIQVVEYTGYADGCFAEWAQKMKCVIGLPRQCPCNGCDLGQPGQSPNPCPAEEQALTDCQSKLQPDGSSGEVAGAHGTCSWYKSNGGVCGASCDAGRAYLSVTCQGSPSGAQACNCEAAGAPLYNWDPVDPAGARGGVSFYADNCPGVAQKMADGACASILNCCFTWQPLAEPGKQSVQQCSCTSDPKSVGYDSCEDIAMKGGGKVVDICPQFLADSPKFPD